ncbi:MAG: gamma-glutamyl-gamma-aminobutyrate hydrolase family protein [Alphaproteobacteria bacterium]|nr:gamma-glutamyl-gamma-aminobutyrate hydrolase family protein [Alphaproteobacteria bacterium]
MSSRPLIGIPCCTATANNRPTHWVAEKYIVAVHDAADAVPMLLPAIADRGGIDDVVSRIDGLFLTGSRSNIEPVRYGGAPDPKEPDEDDPRDVKRDALTLPLIRAAVSANVPILAICRGCQELNVALGGTLCHKVHELDGHIDHRSRHIPIEKRYEYTAHPVRLSPGGALARLADTTEMVVNSLHWQGIDRLGEDLEVEAAAPDGLVEAVRHQRADFIVGIQWHPEYRVMDNPFSRALFAAWGEACRRYAAGRRMRPSNPTSSAFSAASRSPAI